MSKITVTPIGTRRIIIYTGEVAHLGKALHEAALRDPALSDQILTAATAITYTNRSTEIGDAMIEMVLHPENT